MKYIHPRSEQLQLAVANIPADTPVMMLNLLRFRDQADYSESGDSGTILSGRDAYSEYVRHASVCIAKVGAELIWSGDTRHTLIGPESEQWHQAFVVRYPSIQAFFDMIQSADYQAIVHHRSAALADSRLIANTESPGQ